MLCDSLCRGHLGLEEGGEPGFSEDDERVLEMMAVIVVTNNVNMFCAMNCTFLNGLNGPHKNYH